MDPPGTVFYLAAFDSDKYALEVIKDANNRRLYCWREDVGPALRIGVDQKRDTKILGQFGRRQHNDVILGHRFPRNDQCFFDFNETTGELMLHDISEQKDTDLYDIRVLNNGQKEVQGEPQIWRTDHRQCAVVLSPDAYVDPDHLVPRRWILRIHNAHFLLIPRATQGQDEAALTREKLAFAAQHDPEQTVEGTTQRIFRRGVESLRSEAQVTASELTTTYMTSSTINAHDTRFRSVVEARGNNVTRYIKLRRLGRGGQGEVHEVVDMYSGEHFACKIMEVKSSIPERKIYSARDFRAKTEQEVQWVRQICSPHIVPYMRCQGFERSPFIEIFMPVYEGNLHDMMARERLKGQDALCAMILTMLMHILTALDAMHTQNPPLIHRDVKPANILYKGGTFLLTDFGIAKAVDSSATMTGTPAYAAPEIYTRSNQTTKVDIYGLGATVVECLAEFPEEEKRKEAFPDWMPWHRHLQRLLRQYLPILAYMLDNAADERPTARRLLEDLQSLRTSPASASPVTNGSGGADGTSMAYSKTPTPMDWTSTNQADGETIAYLPAPTPMDWSRAADSTVPEPPRHDEVRPSQRNPVIQPRKYPNQAGQPGVRYAKSVQSARSARSARSATTARTAGAAESRGEGRKGAGSSKKGGRAPPPPLGGVAKRSSGRKPRPKTKSTQGAQATRI